MYFKILYLAGKKDRNRLSFDKTKFSTITMLVKNHKHLVKFSYLKEIVWNSSSLYDETMKINMVSQFIERHSFLFTT